MSTVVEFQPKNKSGYVMPRPSHLVRWQHSLAGEFYPAIVTQVGRTGISVVVFPSDSRVGLPRDGVIHVTDPRAKTLVSPDCGLWDYTEEWYAFQNLVQAIDIMSDNMSAVVLNFQKQFEAQHQLHQDLRSELEVIKEALGASLSQEAGAELKERIGRLESAFLPEGAGE